MGGTGVEHRGWAMNDGTSLDWVPHPTADGSVTFLSSEFGEHFHSLQGAWDEALIKFVGPTGLGTWTGQSIRLLDICYGLGYNSAAALAVLWSVAPQCSVQWLGLERDPSVAIAAIPSVLATLDRVQGTTLPARAIHPDQGEPIVLTPEAIALTRTVITQLAETNGQADAAETNQPTLGETLSPVLSQVAGLGERLDGIRAALELFV